MLKTIVVILLVLSLAESTARLIPLSNENYWPIGIAAREIAFWFIPLNLLGALIAYGRWRPLVLVFLTSLLLAVWPLWQVGGIADGMASQWTSQGFPSSALHAPGRIEVFSRSFRGMGGPEVPAQPLPPKILLYKAAAVRDGALLPTLINIHGGAWQDGSAADNSEFSGYMASKGYAVFSIDYRRAPGYRFPAQIDDVRDAIEWIYSNASQYGADPTRIALIGRSAGGHLALLAAYTSSRIPIRAVVSFYGPPDLKEGYEDLPSPDPLGVRKVLEEFLGGSPDQVPNAYRDSSPVHYARAGLPPTLQIQGDSDHAVKPRFARELHQELLAKGSRSLLLEIPWAEHAFDYIFFGPGSVLAMSYLEPFLAETLR